MVASVDIESDDGTVGTVGRGGGTGCFLMDDSVVAGGEFNDEADISGSS